MATTFRRLMQKKIHLPPTVVAYDLETTGLDTLLDRVTQFAASSSEGGVSLASYTNPAPRKVSSKATQITGITSAQLQDSPPFHKVWAEFAQMIKTLHKDTPRDLVIVGHNSHTFDDIMLASELARMNIDLVASLKPHCENIWFGDTLRAARKMRKMGIHLHGADNLRLGTLYQKMTGRELDGAHDALNDCNAVNVLISQWGDLQSYLELQPWTTRLEILAKRRMQRGVQMPPTTAPIQPPPGNVYKNNKNKSKTPPGTKTIITKPKLACKRKSIVGCPKCAKSYSTYFVHVC